MSSFDVQYSLGVDNSQLVAELRRSRREFATVGTVAKDSARQIGDQWSALRNRLVGVVAGVGLGRLAIEAVKTEASLQALDNTLRFASGSQAEYARNSAFLRQQVAALGLDLMSAGKAFVSLTAAARGTSLEGEGVRSIFDAVSKAGTVMMLSSEQQQGALLAIQQMMSKGTVQAEELRGQLGERLPGAFQIAARAMKMSTRDLGKALEQGLVESAEFLPRFAAQLRREMSAGVEGAAQSVQAEFGRLVTAKDEALAALSQGDLAKALVKGLAEVLPTIGDVLGKAKIDVRLWAEFVANQFGDAADAVASFVRTTRREFLTLSTLTQQLKNLVFTNPAEIVSKMRETGDAYRKEMADLNAAPIDPFRKALERRREAARAAINDPELRKLARMDAERQRAADEAVLAGAPKLGRGKSGGGTAARASDRLLDEIRKRRALALAELDGREKLTEAERFAVGVADALADSENKLSSAQKARVEAALKDYLISAQQLEQRQQSIALARTENQLFDDELRSLSAIAQAKSDTIAINRESIEAMQDELRLMTMTRAEQEKHIQLKRLDATIGDTMRRIDDEVVAAQERGDDGAARRLAGQREEVQRLAADMRGKLIRAIEARYAAERDGLLGVKAAATEYVDAARDRFSQLRDLTGNVFRSLEDMLVEFVTTGKANFGDLVRYAIAEITRIAVVKPLLDEIAQSIRGISGQDGGGLLGSIASAIGAALGGGGSGMPDSVPTRGGRRHGGNVERGGMYEVNEAGAELFSQGGRDYLMVGAGGRVSPLGLARQQPAGGNLSVKIINSAGAKVTTRERRDEAGNMQVEALIEAVEQRLGERVDGGLGLANNFGRRFGLNSSAGLMR